MVTLPLNGKNVGKGFNTMLQRANAGKGSFSWTSPNNWADNGIIRQWNYQITDHISMIRSSGIKNGELSAAWWQY